MFNNKRQTAASIDLPRLVSGAVSDTGVITVTGLAADNENVSVVILNDQAPGNISLVPGGVGAEGFTVGTNQVTVDASYEGKTAIVYFRKTETNIKITGGQYYTPYKNVELFAKICGTRFNPMRIWIPRATSLNGVNLDPKADEFTRELSRSSFRW